MLWVVRVNGLGLSLLGTTSGMIHCGDGRRVWDGMAAPDACGGRWWPLLGGEIFRAEAEARTGVLLLHGGTFDLTGVGRPSGDSCARARLEAILSAHPGWVAAVRWWIGRGGRVALAPGGCDEVLGRDEEAWELLAEVFPRLIRLEGPFSAKPWAGGVVWSGSPNQSEARGKRGTL